MLLQKLLKLKYVKAITERYIYIVGLTVLKFFVVGISLALLVSPPDYQQGDFVRIMYIHVPAAWASMGIYAIIASAGVSYIIWRNQISALIMRSSIPIGMVYALICLVTGMLWGKPIWGTYWVWDARLTSMLILFFLFVGLQILINSFENEARAYSATAMLAIVGLVNIPIIRFSVKWWNTLHQPASVMKFSAPSISSEMIIALLTMLGFYFSFYLFLLILNVRKLTLQKKIARHMVSLKPALYS